MRADLLVLCKVDFLKRLFFKHLNDFMKSLRQKKKFTLASYLIMENICASLKMALFFTEIV